MTDQAPKPRRNWIPIVFGIVFAGFIVIIGISIFAVAWFRDNMSVAQVSDDEAMRAFDEILAKFPGQQPLLEFRDGVPRYVADRATKAPSTTQLSTLHILAFDDDDGELARFQLPFWLLRMKSGPIEFSGYAAGLDEGGVNLSVEDIEKHGPGIVLDYTRPGEGRALVWAQ